MTTNLNETFAAVQVASRELALLNDNVINQILNAVADAAIAGATFHSFRERKRPRTDGQK